ncbi:hypothetical protein KL86PLE_100354 [uncultured Pleomorphomonas sp.]|uniref:Uncharacterized protein n=1 Tax=uncultured Pleomorphomonas sp. TaxID=442121 RepID=A0A212L2T4_9HYPH|nr:hypothetical protein KL86PLE_100354 [uncultured Pleomorphomonas sp.]
MERAAEDAFRVAPLIFETEKRLISAAGRPNS